MFDRLKPDTGLEGLICQCHTRAKHVQQFYRLPGVCRRFNSIIRQSPNLHAMLYIKDSFRGIHLHNLCAYIARDCSSVQKMVGMCGSPYVEAALTALLSHEDGPSKLTTLDLSASVRKGFCQLYDTVLLLVTQFSSLTACALDVNSTLANGQQYSFDLGALNALPHLAWLELSHGNFTSLQAASHLTYLSLMSCQVKCGADCGFASSLVVLYLTAGVVLADFHTHGICACCSLCELECEDSEILAGTPAESLRNIGDEALEIPSSLACLTNLTSIQFDHVDRSNVKVQFGWLSHLPSLRYIRIDFDMMVAEFPESLSTLSNLTRLDVSGEGEINFSVDWARLVSLKELHIGPGQVRFTETVAHLPCLARLRVVALFYCVGSSDAITTTQIALLAYKLGARSDVTFMINA